GSLASAIKVAKPDFVTSRVGRRRKRIEGLAPQPTTMLIGDHERVVLNPEPSRRPSTRPREHRNKGKQHHDREGDEPSPRDVPFKRWRSPGCRSCAGLLPCVKLADGDQDATAARAGQVPDRQAALVLPLLRRPHCDTEMRG